ncbi:MAG: hypothetical protein ACP5OV_07770, partial [Acidimicrobiales bacterium]
MGHPSCGASWRGRGGRRRRATGIGLAALAAMAAAAVTSAPVGAGRSEAAARPRAASAVSWQELGPRAVPDLLISFLPSGIDASPPTMGLLSAGEVTTVAADPADPSVLYVGAGGGMW